MADALNPAGFIYEGFWTDWTNGNTWGLTWTLCPTRATILTNSLAVFVTLWGIQLWTIIRYTLHHWGASFGQEVSTPHLNKQQLILRNATSALATARLMLELAWTSRTSTGRRSLRAYAIGMSASIYALFFMAASIFSNKAISAATANGTSTVLLRSNQCGIWNETYYDIVANQNLSDEEDFGMFTQYVAKSAYDVQLSLQYAQQCYLSGAGLDGGSPDCNTLRSPTVGWKPSHAGSCPFGSQLCHEAAETVVLDTGQIDSHLHFGINAKPHDRLRYQRVTTCTVLNGSSHINGWNGTVQNNFGAGPLPETAYAYYGASTKQKTAWTYSHSNFASFYTNFSAQVTSPYQVDVEQAQPGSTSRDFEPIPELAQEKIDLSLIFLSFTGMYLGQVNDPWFSAKREQIFDSRTTFLEKRYAPDTAISTIGCTEEHRFCTSSNICTDFLGFDQVQHVDSFNAALNPNQNATFDRILRAVADSRIWHVVQGLSRTTTPLLASNAWFAGASGAVLSQPLPDNQWKLELEYWHSIAMSQLQRSVVRWATGQVAAEPQHVKYLLQPRQPQDIWFCKSLAIHSTIYQSFKVLAIILIIITGTLVIVVSLAIEHLTAIIRKWFRKPAPRKHWDHDDMLELRRATTKAARKPPPLPKDDGYVPAVLSRDSRRTPVINSAPSISIDRGIHARIVVPHNPTLSDHNDSATAFPSGYRTRVEPASHQVPRDSWIAISLDSLDARLPDATMNPLDKAKMWV